MGEISPRQDDVTVSYYFSARARRRNQACDSGRSSSATVAAQAASGTRNGTDRAPTTVSRQSRLASPAETASSTAAQATLRQVRTAKVAAPADQAITIPQPR